MIVCSVTSRFKGTEYVYTIIYIKIRWISLVLIEILISITATSSIYKCDQGLNCIEKRGIVLNYNDIV